MSLDNGMSDDVRRTNTNLLCSASTICLVRYIHAREKAVQDKNAKKIFSFSYHLLFLLIDGFKAFTTFLLKKNRPPFHRLALTMAKPATTKHVMLSYQWKVQKLAESMHDYLVDKKIPVWMDIKSGEPTKNLYEG